MSKKNGWGTFLTGALVGGALGILFAPKKGSETRQELKEKMTELYSKAKEIDVVEVKESILNKVEEIMDIIQDLDKEKVKDIALETAERLKEKCGELVSLAKEKATPVVEKAANEVREKAILVTKEVLKKLEEGKN